MLHHNWVVKLELTHTEKQSQIIKYKLPYILYTVEDYQREQ